MRENWVIPAMLAVIGFFGGWGVKLIVDRLTLIADKLNALQNLFTAHDKDIIHLQHHVDRIDKELEYHNDRLRDLEQHTQHEAKRSH